MVDSNHGEDGGIRTPFVGTVVEILAVALTLGAIAWGADVYRLVGLKIYNEQFIATMLSIALALAFLHLPVRRKTSRAKVPWYDLLAAVAVFGAGMYLAVQYPKLADLILLRPLDAVAVGTVIIVLGLEALRRATGNILPVIVGFFILYALLCDLLPGQLAGRAQDWQRLAAYLAFDVNGMMGIPLFVASTIVISFVLFGNLLGVTGGSQFFTEAALVAMGRFRGGAAKIAVVASALFGTISGSAVANVVATGIVTIPMIKKSGYPGYKAGAIEAVASTGGQLMPPVMGAAAFLMAEFLQISYGTVVLSAVIPSILYYAALFIQSDLEAAKAGITRVPEAEIPPLRKVLAGWHFAIPFVVLLVCLFHYNLQPDTAVLLSAISLLLFSFLFGYYGKRPPIRLVFASLRGTGLAVLEIMTICLGAGLVIGILNVSGLGFNLTMALVQFGGGHLLLLLLLSAAVCIVLGMGMPTVGVYVLLATLVAPALVKVGIHPTAAHLYVMYFGMMSMITPPVAVAAYAAAAIAQADPVRTGFEAVRLGWSAYIVPFLFVASPTLIMIGDAETVVIATATAMMGIWTASIGVVGYFMRPVPLPMRIAFFAAGVLALIPAGAFPGAFYTDLVGVLAGFIFIIREILIVRGLRRRSDT